MLIQYLPLDRFAEFWLCQYRQILNAFFFYCFCLCSSFLNEVDFFFFQSFIKEKVKFCKAKTKLSFFLPFFFFILVKWPEDDPEEEVRAEDVPVAADAALVEEKEYHFVTHKEIQLVLPPNLREEVAEESLQLRKDTIREPLKQ